MARSGVAARRCTRRDRSSGRFDARRGFATATRQPGRESRNFKAATSRALIPLAEMRLSSNTRSPCVGLRGALLANGSGAAVSGRRHAPASGSSLARLQLAEMSRARPSTVSLLVPADPRPGRSPLTAKKSGARARAATKRRHGGVWRALTGSQRERSTGCPARTKPGGHQRSLRRSDSRSKDAGFPDGGASGAPKIIAHQVCPSHQLILSCAPSVCSDLADAGGVMAANAPVFRAGVDLVTERSDPSTKRANRSGTDGGLYRHRRQGHADHLSAMRRARCAFKPGSPFGDPSVIVSRPATSRRRPGRDSCSW
jgi:hypothetical protein